MSEFITENSKQTQRLGQLLAEEISVGQGSTLNKKRLNLNKSLIICLVGDLGAGKTTFTQGLLKGLKIKGPYTSPTFAIMKHYRKKITNPKSQIPNKSKIKNVKKYQIPDTQYQLLNIYHIDAYRVRVKDILNLGWEEMIADNPPAGGNIIIIEWADRIKKIIPARAVWIKFAGVDEKKRKIKFQSGDN